jgi:hypothetical protein
MDLETQTNIKDENVEMERKDEKQKQWLPNMAATDPYAKLSLYLSLLNEIDIWASKSRNSNHHVWWKVQQEKEHVLH